MTAKKRKKERKKERKEKRQLIHDHDLCGPVLNGTLHVHLQSYGLACSSSQDCGTSHLSL